jgi:acyl carrier protein
MSAPPTAGDQSAAFALLIGDSARDRHLGRLRTSPPDSRVGPMTDSRVGPMTDLSTEELPAAVRTLVAAAMNIPAAGLDIRRSLHEPCLDSVGTVTIRKRLEKRSGCSFLAEVFWQAPSVTTIADHLAGSREEP